MTPESRANVLALALGFAVAGLCSSAYQLVTSRLPSFGLLSAGPQPGDLRRGAVADVRGAVHHHAQHAARPPPGRPPLRVRVPGHPGRRLLEPDVGPGAGDDACRPAASCSPKPLPISRCRCNGRASAGETRMPIYELDGQAPEFPGDGQYWVAETAVLIGRVRLKTRRQRLVRRGAARRQRMDRARRALADPGQRHAAHRSRAFRW